MEKLSNFVEFIDCFVLIACAECSNNDLKALMKPIIAPMDLFLALNEDFKWTNSYSFDNETLINLLGENADKIINYTENNQQQQAKQEESFNCTKQSCTDLSEYIYI
jgi:diphthamide synthase subunit DPH2